MSDPETCMVYHRTAFRLEACRVCDGVRLALRTSVTRKREQEGDDEYIDAGIVRMWRVDMCSRCEIEAEQELPELHPGDAAVIDRLRHERDAYKKVCEAQAALLAAYRLRNNYRNVDSVLTRLREARARLDELLERP